MLEDVHDEDGEAQAEDVGREAGIEVGVGVLLQASRKAERRVRVGTSFLGNSLQLMCVGERSLSWGPGGPCTLYLPELSLCSKVTITFSYSVYIFAKWERHKPICK